MKEFLTAFKEGFTAFLPRSADELGACCGLVTAAVFAIAVVIILTYILMRIAV